MADDIVENNKATQNIDSLVEIRKSDDVTVESTRVVLNFFSDLRARESKSPFLSREEQKEEAMKLLDEIKDKYADRPDFIQVVAGTFRGLAAGNEISRQNAKQGEYEAKLERYSSYANRLGLPLESKPEKDAL